MSGQRALVVSLHDVSPRTRPAFETMLAELAVWGVDRCSLLVIPDHHGAGNFRADPDFCRWLERLAAAGHELVAHGYYHRRPARGNESPWARWLTRVYTAGEGEFYDLPEAAAAGLLERAKADFAVLDAPAPTGFIAPAWLLGEAAARAVRAAGFQYTTRLGEVEDFRTGVTVHSQSLVYSCRNAWRRAASLAWNGWLAGRLRSSPLARLSLHPPDRAHPAIWSQVRSIVRDALRDRLPLTYADFLRRRASSPA